MLARVMTLRFDPVISGFDDTPLREFLKDKEVLSIRDHFFLKNEVPYLTVLVTYDLHPAASGSQPAETPGQKNQSWRELVSPEALPLFNTLRDWRAERCKREGIPPYVICTNRQLAAMVQTRPQSLSQLAEIEGFGSAKLEKYGSAILAILAKAPTVPQAPVAPPEEKEPDHDPAQT